MTRTRPEKKSLEQEDEEAKNGIYAYLEKAEKEAEERARHKLVFRSVRDMQYKD